MRLHCVCVRIWNGFYICVRLAWFTSHKHTPHWPHTSDEEEQSALCLDINDQLVPKQNASSDWMRHHAHSHHSIAQRSHTSGTPNWNPRDSISPNTLAICVLNTLLLVYCLTLYVMFAITLHYRRCQRQVWMDGCDRERESCVSAAASSCIYSDLSRNSVACWCECSKSLFSKVSVLSNKRRFRVIRSSRRLIHEAFVICDLIRYALN